MVQEIGDGGRISEERKDKLVGQIRRRVSRGRDLSPAFKNVLKRIGLEAEIDVAIDAGREEGIEPTPGEIDRIKR